MSKEASPLLDNCVITVIDIGDSFMRGGVFVDGATRQLAAIPTPKAGRGRSGEANLLDAVRIMVGEIGDEAGPMQALAVSASGIMTLQDRPGARAYGPFRDHELYVLAPNVDGLKYVPLLRRLEELGFDVPVHVENDVNAALRSATDVDDAVCISLGAGLGAAAKRDGHIDHVAGTWSCYEIGHGMRWDLPERVTRRCHCGNNGCLEAVVGGWAMTERYRCRPEDAPADVYDAMREDVVAFLPEAIASVVRQTGLRTVLMTGKGSVGYASESDFLARLRERTEDVLDDGVNVRIDLMPLAETAELHGVALALLDHDVHVNVQQQSPIA